MSLSDTPKLGLAPNLEKKMLPLPAGIGVYTSFFTLPLGGSSVSEGRAGSVYVFSRPWHFASQSLCFDVFSTHMEFPVRWQSLGQPPRYPFRRHHPRIGSLSSRAATGSLDGEGHRQLSRRGIRHRFRQQAFFRHKQSQ